MHMNFSVDLTNQLSSELFLHQKKPHKALLQEITFCLPPQCAPSNAQKKDAAHGVIYPTLQYTVFYNWIYQTWDLLKKAGIPCQLSTELPNKGIIVTLGQTLPASYQEKIASRKLVLIDVVADNKPCAAGSLHLIQNKAHAEQINNSCFIPHWPQPHLIPRHAERKNRFENIGFFGHIKNLAPELQSSLWHKQLQEKSGLTFKVKNPPEWHDYSDVDCVVAIRNFSAEPYFNKPATKLYNAWLAGIPFIGGSDTAYATDGQAGKNYLVATSLEELLQHLHHLKKDEIFRKKLIEEGRKAALYFTQQATLERWRKIVSEVIPRLAMQDGVLN